MDLTSLAAAAAAALVPALAEGASKLAAGVLKDLYHSVLQSLSSNGEADKREAIEKDPAGNRTELEHLVKTVMEKNPALRSRLAEHFSVQQQQTNNTPLVGSIQSEKSVVAGQIANLTM